MARNAIRAGMLHAKPQRIDPSRKSATPMRMSGLRPRVSESFAYTGTDTACASR